MNMPNEFRISIGDDPDHDDLTAEIFYREEYIAMISQEGGLENALLEVQPGSDGKGLLVPLDDFVRVLVLAKQRLWELRRG